MRPGRPRTREPRKPGTTPSASSANPPENKQPSTPVPRITKTPKLCQAVLAEVMKGGTLRAIGEMEGMPSKSAFLEWVSQDQDLADQYTRAMEIRADHGFDEIIELADTATEKNYRAIQVRISTRQWAYGRMKPKKYGDFQRNELTAADGAPLFRSMTDDQLDARLAALILGAQPGAEVGNGHAPRGEGQAAAREQTQGVLP